MINENIEDIILKMPICFGPTDNESRWKWNVSNILAFKHTTNCGSQLVGMLEEFNRKYTNKYDWHSYDVIVHEDMHEGTCRTTLSYLSEDYADWLCGKGYETYHGIKMVSNFSSKEIDNVLKIFKLNQSGKGINVYG